MSKMYYPYKPEPGMQGPFPLTDAMIGKVTDDLYGVYLLTVKGTTSANIVIYVGRGIVKDRMREHIVEKGATAFYVKPLDDDDVGFAEECRLFHVYGKTTFLDNERHPAVPAGSPKGAPRCTVKGCDGSGS